MEGYISFLRSTSLFKSFSFDEIGKLFIDGLYKIKEYKRNSIVYFQNEKCNTLDIILKGTIIVQKIDSNGNVLTISDFTIGDALGGNLLFSHRNSYPMIVASKSDAIILHIEKQMILELCQDNIIFLKEFLQLISDKTLILTDKIKSLTMKTIRQCIVEFLLFEYYSQGNIIINLDISKKELAERIGVQRPSLSRELNKMRKDGLIEYDAHSIIISNIDELIKVNIDT